MKRHGIPVVDTDEIAREVAKNAEILQQIRDEISEEVFDEAGNLDRKKMGRLVFSWKMRERKEKLNKIMHPFILARMWEQSKSMKKAMM